MVLDFLVTDGRYGGRLDSDGITCQLDLSTHEELFGTLARIEPSFPLLQRFADFYDDGFVGRESMERFISEIEHATMQFDRESPVKQFFDCQQVDTAKKGKDVRSRRAGEKYPKKVFDRKNRQRELFENFHPDPPGRRQVGNSLKREVYEAEND